MACLIEEYFVNDVEIEFIESENLALNEYLKKINFIYYWQKSFLRSDFVQKTKDTNLNLWKLENKSLFPYVNHAKNFFTDYHIKDKDVEPFTIILSELFNNIIDHSKSKVSGFTITQYFPKNNKIKISICDFGIGIVESINTFFEKNEKPKISQIDAFNLAVKHGFSTQSTPQNRGLGLDTLMSIVKTNNGKLRIVTNQVLFVFDEGIVKIVEVRENFQGTHLDITLNVDNFYEKEELNLDNFDF